MNDYPTLDVIADGCWPGGNAIKTQQKLRAEVLAVLTEIERLHTWDGLMSLLDKHYPPDVFDGSSGDPGPSILVLIRAVEELRAEVERLGVIKRAAEQVVSQTTPKSAYRRHDALIEAIEADKAGKKGE